MYDYLHKHKGVFKLPALLGVAMDVSKGMSYLHQNNIIHRDLKTANLLMDENGVSNVGKLLPEYVLSFSTFFLEVNSLLSNMKNAFIVGNEFLVPELASCWFIAR